MSMSEYLRMSRFAESEDLEAAGHPEVRIAVLGDSSTQPICKVLRTALFEQKFTGQIFDADFDSIALEAYDENSALHRFGPEFVILYLCSEAVRERYYATSAEEKAGFAARYLEELRGVVSALSAKGYRIIIQTLAWPQERHFGNYSATVSISPLSLVQEINRGIIDLAQGDAAIHLHDAAYLAAQIGLDAWHEEKLWAQAKYMCALRCLPTVAASLSRIIAAGKGKVTKCIALDLDNTLWGGVIGDDGIEGIELEEGAIGEAYSRFQSYLKALKERGYVLAVCSKNDEANAKEPFERHSGMKLKLEDIAVLVANWNDKGSNIRYIAEVLNLGLDSIVFIDDSAFEREQVRSMLPEVIVPEMPDDPTQFATFLEASGVLEAIGFTGEDAKRAQMYREQATRSEAKLTFGNIDDYLASLQMKLRIRRFDREHLQRIEQLLQRSNQFNLCTRRYTKADCERFMNDDERYHPVYLTLEDRFGDYGLIGIVISEIADSTIAVREFVMSCRVLKRGVEQEICNYLFRCCERSGLTSIEGEYRPTAKNAMVEDLYARFGFEKIAKDNGNAIWKLDVSGAKPVATKIEVEEAGAS